MIGMNVAAGQRFLILGNGHRRAGILLVGIGPHLVAGNHHAIDDEAAAGELDAVAGQADDALDQRLAGDRMAEEDNVAARRQMAEQPAVGGGKGRQGDQRRRIGPIAVVELGRHQPVADLERRHHALRGDVVGGEGDGLEDEGEQGGAGNGPRPIGDVRHHRQWFPVGLPCH